MTTIYKTTERQGKRAILSLPLSAEDALAVIKRAFSYLGELPSTKQGISIKFHHGDCPTIYSVEENSLPLQGD